MAWSWPSQCFMFPHPFHGLSWLLFPTIINFKVALAESLKTWSQRVSTYLCTYNPHVWSCMFVSWVDSMFNQGTVFMFCTMRLIWRLQQLKWQDWYCSLNLQHSYQAHTIDTLHVASLQSRCSCLMLPNWSKPRHHSSLQWLRNVKQCLQCIHKMQDCQKQSQAQKLHRSKSQHPIHQESSFSIIATPCKTQILGCSLPFGRHQHQETTS